jgi:hypothetical protein
MNNKSAKIFLSIFLIIISYGFIIYKILNFQQLNELNFSLKNYSLSNLLLFNLVLILMILNWSIETIKWKVLIDKIQKLKFKVALQAILSGITIGIFTPNRIGDLGGRVLYIDKGKRTAGILATGIGSFAQFLTTIFLGLLGFVLFLILLPDKTIENPFLNKITATSILFIFLILLWMYFNINKINPFLLKFTFFKARENQLKYISETNYATLSLTLFLSITRYFIFSSQFYLLLLIFNIDLNLIQAYISISLIYLFTTLIPTTTIIELGIRGSLAIFFIGMFSHNILGIILAAMFLWIINLAIPSIIGSVFFLKKQLS